jgi:hypothetical protein
VLNSCGQKGKIKINSNSGKKLCRTVRLNNNIRRHSHARRQMTRFRIHLTASGQKEITEFPAASESGARRAFDAYKLPGVRITSIEPIEPDAASERVPSTSPDSPFDPLIARRRLDIDEDVR